MCKVEGQEKSGNLVNIIRRICIGFFFSLKLSVEVAILLANHQNDTILIFLRSYLLKPVLNALLNIESKGYLYWGIFQEFYCD